MSEERYLRKDIEGGFLYNKNEISYYRQTQAIDVIENLMLGDYNKNGKYTLDQDLIKQLTKLKKVYQYSFGSTTFCQSVSDIGGFGKIDFAIKMTNNKDHTISSSLQLLETIDRANGYYQNTNSALIAVYTAPESNTYVVDMLKYFNVISKKEEGLIAKEEDIELILARKKYEAQLKITKMSEIENLCKDLYQKRIKLLSKSPAGREILDKFSKEFDKINGWFIKEDMPNYYRSMNQILDGILESNSEAVLNDISLTASLNKAKESFGKDAEKALNKVEKAANDRIEQQEQKEQAANAKIEEQKPTVPEQQKAPETPKENSNNETNKGIRNEESKFKKPVEEHIENKQNEKSLADLMNIATESYKNSKIVQDKSNEVFSKKIKNLSGNQNEINNAIEKINRDKELNM